VIHGGEEAFDLCLRVEHFRVEPERPLVRSMQFELPERSAEGESRENCESVREKFGSSDFMVYICTPE